MKEIIAAGLVFIVSACGSTSNDNKAEAVDAAEFSNSGAYTLLAWNDLGMHCMDGKDFSVFSILPPYNNLNAQLIKRAGTSDKYVTSGVTITYSAVAAGRQIHYDKRL